jgi:uncharacterized Zn finger protein
MPFDNSWQGFPASKPLKAEGGIATTKVRGAMADTWWSKRFVDVLHSYGLGGRMTRGRAYARQGQVLSLEVSAGILAARVQGSRSRPYVVTINVATPSTEQWRTIEVALQSRLGYAAHLLAGEVPSDLEDVFASVGTKLFPARWTDMKATCSCPDWGDPCKHQAAALYVFADQLDRDPWQLLVWQGRSKEQIVSLFAGQTTAVVDPADEIAPWWPLRPGVMVESGGMLPIIPQADMATPPHAALARLGDFDTTANLAPILEALMAAYLPTELGAIEVRQS